MSGFQCPVKKFPCNYLGLPLHIRQLRRVDIQPVIDKVANRLPTWKGSFINKAGRLKLVNSVLSSMPVYFLTVFYLKKWALKKIDKIRRALLWNGTSEANGSKCLVAWDNCKKPKANGGFGVLDLAKFSRALRLRWLWYSWVDPERPWVGSPVPCSENDKQLFRASTMVTVGDGRTAMFWDSTWVNGHAPRDLVPNLYKLAWRKRLKLRDEVDNQTWTRGLWRMSTATEISEFIFLWEVVQGVHFSDVPDLITWKWTANGLYSSKSAYEVQFSGSYCTFNAQAIWKAKTEGKHRFFTWLLVQGKIQTADNLIMKGIQCDPICSLCHQDSETASHLCLHCSFAQQVWSLVRTWTDGLVLVPAQGVNVQEWWNSALQVPDAAKRNRVAAILIYTAWNIWNERNRRIFQGVVQAPQRILGLIKEEMALRQQACELRVNNVVS